tara:strand:+ start:914 stop:1501 length:588 start_codon:yes stop_codon:yes gene_type:complete
MNFNYLHKLFVLFSIFLFLLNSCGIYRPVDAKKYPPEPELRVKKNIEEGRGIRLFGKKDRGGTFDFASSNELWRASLDTIDFMPLLTADYGGGIIVTDWYNDSENDKQSIKVSIRFLSNEVRVDALDIKVFKKNCDVSLNCKIFQNKSNLEKELTKVILKKAAVYSKENKEKNFKEYKGVGVGEAGSPSKGGLFK